jgi:FKBP-type peptidyl-prolyl cis-trans isomerase
MKMGDRAKLIIPSHLAHGLVGDLNKIPPLTTIVVDIHLIDLKL